MFLKLERYDLGFVFINPVHIVNMSGLNPTSILTTSSPYSTKVEESPSKIALMQSALNWDTNILYVDWDKKKNAPRVTTSHTDRNLHFTTSKTYKEGEESEV